MLNQYNGFKREETGIRGHVYSDIQNSVIQLL